MAGLQQTMQKADYIVMGDYRPPPEPVPLIEELAEIMNQLPVKEQVEVLRYAQCRLSQLEGRPSLEEIEETIEQLSLEEREELLELIVETMNHEPNNE